MDSPATTADQAAPAARLSVRVGVGWNPFAGDGLADGRFWEAVEAMEELGYDSVWLADTAALPGAAPLPMLAAVAARTERLKLGIGVLVLPPRNPVLLARELATVDVISGGRLLPAGGLGINIPAELEAMGVRREERVGRLEESRPDRQGALARRAGHHRAGASGRSATCGSSRGRCAAGSSSGSAARHPRRCAGWGGSPTAGSPRSWGRTSSPA